MGSRNTARPFCGTWIACGILLLLAKLVFAASSSHSGSVRINIVDINGIPEQGPFRLNPPEIRHRIVIRECTAENMCSTMGILDTDKASTSLFTAETAAAEDMHGGEPVMSIILRLHKRIPAPIRNGITVETFNETARTGGSDGAQLINAVNRRGEPTELHSLRVTGRSSSGKQTDLHKQWYCSDEVVAEYRVEFTMDEIFACKDRCYFDTAEDKYVQTLQAPRNRLSIIFKLTGQGAEVRTPGPSERLLAARMSEFAFDDPPVVEAGSGGAGEQEILHQLWKRRNGETTCTSYQQVAVLNRGLARVWYLRSESKKKEAVGLYRPNSSPPHVVVAFHIDDDAYLYGTRKRSKEMFEIFTPSSGQSYLGKDRYYGKVSRHYLLAYKSITNELREYLPHGSTVLLTGFSSGAGVATVALADLVLDDSMALKKVSGIMLGSPQVGDASFQAAFQRRIGKSPKYAYLERIVLADGADSRVDAETTMPLAVNEHFSWLGSMHGLDCIRKVVDVESIATHAPGHLGFYVHVGQTRLLFENGSPSPNRTHVEEREREEQGGMASSGQGFELGAFISDKSSRIAAYTERLALAEEERIHQSKNAPTNVGKTRNGLRSFLQSVPWLGEIEPAISSQEHVSKCLDRSGLEGTLAVHVVLPRTPNDQPMARPQSISADLCQRAGDSVNSPLVCRSLLSVHGEVTRRVNPNYKEYGMFSFATERAKTRPRIEESSYITLSVGTRGHSKNCWPAFAMFFDEESMSPVLSEPIYLRDLRREIKAESKPESDVYYKTVLVGNQEIAIAVELLHRVDEGGSKQPASHWELTESDSPTALSRAEGELDGTSGNTKNPSETQNKASPAWQSAYVSSRQPRDGLSKISPAALSTKNSGVQGEVSMFTPENDRANDDINLHRIEENSSEHGATASQKIAKDSSLSNAAFDTRFKREDNDDLRNYKYSHADRLDPQPNAKRHQNEQPMSNEAPKSHGYRLEHEDKELLYDNEQETQNRDMHSKSELKPIFSNNEHNPAAERLHDSAFRRNIRQQDLQENSKTIAGPFDLMHSSAPTGPTTPSLARLHTHYHEFRQPGKSGDPEKDEPPSGKYEVLNQRQSEQNSRNDMDVPSHADAPREAHFHVTYHETGERSSQESAIDDKTDDRSVATTQKSKSAKTQDTTPNGSKMSSSGTIHTDDTGGPAEPAKPRKEGFYGAFRTAQTVARTHTNRRLTDDMPLLERPASQRELHQETLSSSLNAASDLEPVRRKERRSVTPDGDPGLSRKSGAASVDVSQEREDTEFAGSDDPESRFRASLVSKMRGKAKEKGMELLQAASEIPLHQPDFPAIPAIRMKLHRP